MIYRLKDVLEDKGYIRGPFGSALKRSEMLNDGIPVYEQQNAIYENRDFRYYINEEKYEKLKRFTVKENDLIVSCSGTVGKVSIIRKNDEIGIISQALLILRPNIKIVLPEFLYYFFKSNKGYNSIVSRSSGSVQVNIAKRQVIEEIEIEIPTLEEQRGLIQVLSDLDEKIETNNKINKKLEEMAQAIFKQWFVDFEFPNEDGKPYKSSGGEMVESELGMIPKGWEVILLDEIVDTFNGYSYKGKELSESENAMITIKNFDRNGGYKMDGLKEIVISDKVKPHHFVEVNDIIVAHTDLTQGAEIIGNPIMIFSKGSYEKLIMSMDTVKVKSKIKEMNNELLYFILKDYRFKQYALGYINGTTVLHLSKSTIPQYKIALPYDKSIMNQLGDNLSPIMSKIANNFKESEKLIMLRDALLPKLMSGEIRVPMD